MIFDGRRFFSAQDIKKLNDLELKVFEYAMNNTLIIPYLSIRELAADVGVSTTSVLRFVKKLGFDSYNDFKYAFKMWFQNEQHYERNYDFSEVINCLQKLSLSYYHEKFNEAEILIGNSDNIIFLGIGNSGSLCHYAARRFTSAGKFAIAINDPFLNLSSLGLNTLIIVLSVSGETPELIDVVSNSKKDSVKILAITTSQTNTLSKLADLTIPYYIRIVGEKNFDMTSQIPTIAIIENLATLCFHHD